MAPVQQISIILKQTLCCHLKTLAQPLLWLLALDATVVGFMQLLLGFAVMRHKVTGKRMTQVQYLQENVL